jgi:hypothetical protein
MNEDVLYELTTLSYERAVSFFLSLSLSLSLCSTSFSGKSEGRAGNRPKGGKRSNQERGRNIPRMKEYRGEVSRTQEVRERRGRQPLLREQQTVL